MELNHDLQVQKFLDHLKAKDNAADWQIRQAHDAIRLYSNHFKNIGEGNIQKEHSFSDINDLVEKNKAGNPYKALFLQNRTNISGLVKEIF